MAQLESIEYRWAQRCRNFIKRSRWVIQKANYALGKELLIVFTCNHCPYAKAVWPRVIRLGCIAQKNGMNVLAINPNINPDYPDDSPVTKCGIKIKEWGIPFPYLIDDTQKTAREIQGTMYAGYLLV